jgi:tetratricopeptide (TPR) repeat protein
MVAAEDAYLFAHALTRDAAYQLMPPAGRAALHALAADCIEVIGSADGLDDPAAVADHLHQAIRWLGGYSDATRALAHREVTICTAGAAWLAARYRYSHALTLWERAASNPVVEPAVRLAALVDAAETCERASRFADGERLALLAIDGLGTDAAHRHLRARALRMAGACAWRTGQRDAGATRLQEAVDAARAADDRALQGRCRGNLAIVHAQSGRIDDAKAGYAEAIAIARETGDRRSESIALGNLANLQRQTGDIDAASSGFAAARAIAAAIGDRRNEAGTVCNIAILHKQAGDLVAANVHLADALDMARSVGDRWLEGTILCTRGWMREAADDRLDAIRDFERATDTAREVGDRRGEGVASGNLVAIRANGRWTASEDAAIRRAIMLVHDAGDARSEAVFRGDLASGLLALARLSDALAEYDAVIALDRAIGATDLVGSHLRGKARVHEAIGDVVSAEAALRESIATLRAQNDPDEEAASLRALATLMTRLRPNDAEPAQIDARLRQLGR